jgi:hypothetical protein
VLERATLEREAVDRSIWNDSVYGSVSPSVSIPQKDSSHDRKDAVIPTTIVTETKIKRSILSEQYITWLVAHIGPVLHRNCGYLCELYVLAAGRLYGPDQLGFTEPYWTCHGPDGLKV